VNAQRIAAEQALLGAVLLDPAGQRQVLRFVEPGDFERAWHGQVYDAMRRICGHGGLPGPQQVRAELGNDPDLPREIALDGLLIADLMAATPRAVHAPAYAAVVIENGIRQHLWVTGSRVCQTAASGEVIYALDQVAEAADEIRSCGVRWMGLPEPWRRELPDAAGKPPLPAEPADHAGRAEGSRDGAAEISFLRDLAAAPWQLDHVRGWLRREHFTVQANGAVYDLSPDMSSAGLPIDSLTVSREASRRGLPVEQAELAGGLGVFAHLAGRGVYVRAALAQISQAGADLQADADDLRTTMSTLLSTGTDRLTEIWQRWPAEPWHDARPELMRSSRRPVRAAECSSDCNRSVRWRQPQQELECEAV
jgi:replicative DNA helicase